MGYFKPMKNRIVLTLLVVALGVAAMPVHAADPDYTVWNRILHDHYDPTRGMDYERLKAKDLETLRGLRQAMSKVDVAKLDRKEQLAFWINLYNISVVGIVTESYPVESIRDLSTDPIIRLNVFKKESVSFGSAALSLNDIENERIREGFKDPRIHFAINCAARSCPPIRPEAFTGARLDEQLDDQARRFLNGPNGIRLEPGRKKLVIHTTKIMDWFGDDFETWGGGRVAFIKRFASASKREAITKAGNTVKLDYEPYDWDLNLWMK